MKKLLYLLSSSAFALSANSIFAGTLDVTSATTKENAIAISPAGADVVLKTSRPNSEMDTWKDYYVYIDTATLNSLTYSTGGQGYHANYHMMLDANNSSLQTTANTIFNYNANPMTYGGISAAGFYLESKDGTAVSFTTTAANGFSVNLASGDGNLYNESTAGLRGKAFSIGENVTLNATAATIAGKLTTTQPTYADSLFTVAGTLALSDSAKTTSITNANVLVKGTGTATVAGYLSISNTNLTIEEGGSFYANANKNPTSFNENSSIDISGDLFVKAGVYFNEGTTATINSTGAINGMIVLKGGSLVVNGKIANYDGTSNVEMAVTSGNITVGDTGDISKVSALNLRGGIVNVNSDVAISVLRSNASSTTTLNVAAGKTYTADKVNFEAADSNITLKGNVVFNEGVSMGSASNALTIDGTTALGTELSAGNGNVLVNGALTVGEKLSLNTGGVITIA